MLGETSDPLREPGENPACAAILEEYLAGNLELWEAEQKIDWLLEVGQEGERRRAKEEAEERDRVTAKAELDALIEADRNRIARATNAHRRAQKRWQRSEWEEGRGRPVLLDQ